MEKRQLSKLEKGLAAFVAVLMVPGMVFAAADVTTTASATATISTVFSIAVDVTTIPFGTVAPGSTTDLTARNTVTCKSNDAVTWYLKTSYGASQSDTTFQYKTSGAGAGTYVGTYSTFATTSALAYTSVIAEQNNLPAGIDADFDYRLIAAAAAAPGAKSWTVTYTLTQTL